MTNRFYRLLIASGVVFAISLVLALLDGFGWLVLPQPFRLVIPAALVVSMLLGIVLLSGSIGIPKNPRETPEPEPTPEASEMDSVAP